MIRIRHSERQALRLDSEISLILQRIKRARQGLQSIQLMLKSIQILRKRGDSLCQLGVM